MRLWFACISACLIILGATCSDNNRMTSVTDPNPESISSANQVDIENAIGVLGIYEVSINESRSEFEMKPYPQRGLSLGEQFLGEITTFLTSVYCRDCARIDGISLTSDNMIDVSISIRHPFALPTGGPSSAKNRLDLHLFDIEGLVVTDQGTAFTDAGITARPGFLVNADGYTGIFDAAIDQLFPSVNNIHPYRILFEDSSEGNFDSQSSTSGFTDPYVPVGHNVFPQGSYYRSTIFRLDPEPGEVVDFVLIFTASYGVSAKFNIAEGQPGNRLNPRYFLPRFNRHEPWKVKVAVPPFLNFLTSGDPEQTAEVRIDVWDWQDGKQKSSYWNFYTSRAGEFDISSNIKNVVIYEPSLMTQPITLDSSLGSGNNPKKFVARISNQLQAPVGKYWGVACAVDELDGTMSLLAFERDGKSPFLYNSIRTYQIFSVEVNSSSNAIPESPIDVTPSGLNGVATDIIVSENVAFVTTGVLGLLILDVSNPSSPKFLSSIDTYGNATRMAYNPTEKLLYIADGAAGLSIINVNNPSSPTLKGAFDIVNLNDVRDVAIFGGYAYLGDGESGVAIVDVRDPSLPALVGQYSVRPKVRALAIRGSYLYKLDETDGLEILSLSNPESPISVNGLIIVGSKRDIHLRDTTGAILLDDRLVSFDTTQPYNPVLKGSVNLTSPTESVHVIPGFAFVTNGTVGVKVISLEDIANPYVVGGYDTPGYSKACFVWGDKVYVADGDTGVVVLNAGGGSLTFRSRYLTTGMTWGLSVSEQNIFLATGYSGCKSVDIAYPAKAYINGFANTPGYATDCEINRTALYVTDSGSGLAVMSVANPSQPVYLNNIQFPTWENWYAWKIKSLGDYAILWGPQTQSDFPDMIIFDITNEFIPLQRGYLTTSRDFYDITFAGGFVFAAVGLGGVATINISNPTDPNFIALYSNGKNCLSVEGNGQNIFAMFHSSGMEVLSYANPDNLSKIGEANISGTSLDICLSGDYAYVADLEGLVVINISDSANPYVFSTHPLPGTIGEIIVRGNYAFVACRDGGLRIIKLW